MWEFDMNFTSETDPTIHSFLYPDFDGEAEGRYTKNPLLSALTEHRQFAEIFANNLCDMAYEHFSLQNVERVIGIINESSLLEIERSSALYERKVEYVHSARAYMLGIIAMRPYYILTELREIFGYTDMYHIFNDGNTKINTLNSPAGRYFIENRVPVTPVLEKWQVFDHWLVNGEEYYEEDLLISYQMADEDGIVYVACITREELPPLAFLETYDNEEICGFTMYNPTDVTQSTRGLYLSDDIYNLKKWQFPNLNVRPGAVWEFVGDSSPSYDALLKIGLNFNPRYGEALFLSNEAGEILDWMAVTP
jgi:hypothetical protein